MTDMVESLIWQVKSRLLPLSPLESILEWLIETLPRRFIRVGIKPSSDIAVINEPKGEYKATGFAPSFEMMLEIDSNVGGWYYLEAALVRNNGNREAYIRVGTSDRDKKNISIPIPTNLRGTVREVLYLPPNVETLHWLPTAAPGFFSQSQLLVHKITIFESSLRRLHRVIYDLWRFRRRTPDTRCGLSFWEGMSNLQAAYQRTAALRIKRLKGNDYSTFIALNDTLRKSNIRAMGRLLSDLQHQPTLTLIMPVRAPVADYFKEALNSIFGQIYRCWELLLVGDFSADNRSLAIASEYQRKNVSVKIIPIKTGSSFAETLNSALHMAQGEFIARINQHDLIPPHALLSLVLELSKNPDADLIYTDDDSLDEANKRFDPRFKPDWNPDLFLSYNYLGNLTFYRKARALDIGGYRQGFEGAEDYDLYLRYLKGLPATKIRHIPRVLCHTRAIDRAMLEIPFSSLREVGLDMEAVHRSGKDALAAYFESDSIDIEDGPGPCLYHVKYPLPKQQPLVTIIIPTRDRVDILKKCIESIRQKTNYNNWEVLVVNNQSVELETLDYFDHIQDDSRINVIRYEKPFNYSALNNFAVKYARGEIIALLNNDVEVIANEWLSEMVSHVMRPEIGAVGAKLLYSNGMVQHAGVIIGLGGVAGHAHKYLKGDDHGYGHRAVVVQNLSAVTGACLVVRKSCYEEVGGLNEADLAVAFNDVDFCLKLGVAGYRHVFTPNALLYHHESISRGHDDTPEKHALFLKEFNYMKKTWGGVLKQDPTYNPNLTLDFEDFSFKTDR